MVGEDSPNLVALMPNDKKVFVRAENNQQFGWTYLWENRRFAN
jgi:hypothetical protein